VVVHGQVPLALEIQDVNIMVMKMAALQIQVLMAVVLGAVALALQIPTHALVRLTVALAHLDVLQVMDASIIIL